MGSVTMVGEKLKGMTTQVVAGKPQSQIPSTRNFTIIDAFDISSFPTLQPNEALLPDQALHYLIISVVLTMEQQQSVAATIFYGLDETSADEHSLMLVEYISIYFTLVKDLFHACIV